MANLPRQYPDLVVHLCDHALTPIISSSSSSPNRPNGTNGTNTSQSSTPRQKERALDDLASTALRARSAAARLGLGHQPGAAAGGQELRRPDLISAPPQHIVVSYNTGAVLLESFVDPLSPPQESSDNNDNINNATSPATSQPNHHNPPTAAALSRSNGNGNSANAPPLRGPAAGRSNGLEATLKSTHISRPPPPPLYSPAGQHVQADDTAEAPLLVGLVAAPNMQALPDATRATTRLERFGRTFQNELLADRARQR